MEVDVKGRTTFQKKTGDPRQHNYEELANAIVLRAVDDYRKSLKTSRGSKGCETFFKSSWFMTLTDVDGRVVLNRLKFEGVQEKFVKAVTRMDKTLKTVGAKSDMKTFMTDEVKKKLKGTDPIKNDEMYVEGYAAALEMAVKVINNMRFDVIRKKAKENEEKAEKKLKKIQSKTEKTEEKAVKNDGNKDKPKVGKRNGNTGEDKTDTAE